MRRFLPREHVPDDLHHVSRDVSPDAKLPYPALDLVQRVGIPSGRRRALLVYQEGHDDGADLRLGRAWFPMIYRAAFRAKHLRHFGPERLAGAPFVTWLTRVALASPESIGAIYVVHAAEPPDKLVFVG